MCHRQKFSSFLRDGRTFITAPLNYRYAVAGSSTLVTGDPIVDFIFHSPAQMLDTWNQGGILPEATDGQKPPWLPEQEFKFPAGLPTSIAEFLGGGDTWSSY
jgi:hypothetical protein